MENDMKMKARQEPSFGEQIIKKISEQPEKNTTHLINDAFYLLEIDRAIPFYVRRTNMLREEANKKFSARRTFNVPDYEQEQK